MASARHVYQEDPDRTSSLQHKLYLLEILRPQNSLTSSRPKLPYQIFSICSQVHTPTQILLYFKSLMVKMLTQKYFDVHN